MFDDDEDDSEVSAIADRAPQQQHPATAAIIKTRPTYFLQTMNPPSGGKYWCDPSGRARKKQPTSAERPKPHHLNKPSVCDMSGCVRTSRAALGARSVGRTHSHPAASRR